MVSWLVDFQARRDLNIVCTGVGTAAGLVEFLPVIPRHEFVFGGAKKTKPNRKKNAIKNPFYRCLLFSKLRKGGPTLNPMGPADNAEV